MLKKIVKKIWQAIPRKGRVTLIRVTQKKFTVSVGAVVLNENGEVLLLDHVLRPSSGWGMPGGFINHGEQPERAIRRELMEETGLELENIELVLFRTIGKHVEFIFRCDGIGEARVKSHEISAAKWFSPDNLPADLAHVQKNMINIALRNGVKVEN